MVKVWLSLLIAAFFCAVLAPAIFGSQKLFPDDPIQAVPAPKPVKQVQKRDINEEGDFVRESFSRHPEKVEAIPAGAVNTLGDVPDSDWFTNRHARRRLTAEELQRGPGNASTPVAPFTVTSGKTEGIAPGFRMRDAMGRTYFVKLDPMTNAEMASASDVLGSKFLWAAGYYTPENYIAYAHLEDFHVADDATITGPAGGKRKMTRGDFKEITKSTPHYTDGTFRMMASLKVEGESVGPFRYQGTRSDDPNDIVPHENRRDLRGLFVIAAWMNHTDAKANNSYDTVVEKNGVRFIRHYLLDFGSAFGSDGDKAKDARFGHEFIIPSPSEAVTKILSLGLIPARWERARFPHIEAVGNFESDTFEPDKWKSDYPNPAFLSRLPDDDYWGAKQVMAFTDEDIKSIVDVARFSDPRAAPYMVATLAARRDKIGRTFFSKVLPLDHFRVENDALQFDDLAVLYKFRGPEQYTIEWYQFDNRTRRMDRLAGEQSTHLPSQAAGAPATAYFAAVIKGGKQTVWVYVRKRTDGFDVAGLDRTW
jgi:hypothetical protein